MHNYYFKIEVTGRGQFPLDQLRRYEMFPLDLETVQTIEDSITLPSEDGLYKLGMYASTFGADSACIARFESFGFNGITVEVWRGGKLYYANGEVVIESTSCGHDAYVTRSDEFGVDHPFCRTCDEFVSL